MGTDNNPQGPPMHVGFGLLELTCPVCGHKDLLKHGDHIATSGTENPIQKFGCGHAAAFDGAPVN